MRTRFPETDLVIVRENTEDLYAGIEFERGTADNAALREKLAELGCTVREDAGISIKPISVFGSERIVRHAFDYAVTHGHKKVVAAHKANIMKFSDGLFLEVAREVAADYPAIEFEDCIIDNLCNQLITYPEDFEVIVLPNLYGDIVSDLCAAMIGGLGVAGGAQHRHRRRRVRGDARIVADVRGLQPHEPDGADAVGRLHARPPEETAAARALEHAIADGHPQGRQGHLRPQAKPDRPHRRRHQRSSPTR